MHHSANVGEHNRRRALTLVHPWSKGKSARTKVPLLYAKIIHQPNKLASRDRLRHPVQDPAHPSEKDDLFFPHLFVFLNIQFVTNRKYFNFAQHHKIGSGLTQSPRSISSDTASERSHQGQYAGLSVHNSAHVSEPNKGPTLVYTCSKGKPTGRKYLGRVQKSSTNLTN